MLLLTKNIFIEFKDSGSDLDTFPRISQNWVKQVSGRPNKRTEEVGGDVRTLSNTFSLYAQ